MAINLVYAAAMVRARLVTLAVVVAVSAGLLAYKASSYGSLDFGYAWDTLGFGFARVAFGFTLGVLMARVDRRRIRQGIAPLALAIVLAAALCMPVEGLRRTGFDLGFAFLAAPAIVWFGAAINPLPALTFTSRWLGELSYPVYALHYPLLGAAVFVAQRYGWPTGIWVVLFVAALLVVCLALSRGIEHPIRSRLNARLAAALGRSRKTMVQPSRR